MLGGLFVNLSEGFPQFLSSSGNEPATSRCIAGQGEPGRGLRPSNHVLLLLKQSQRASVRRGHQPDDAGLFGSLTCPFIVAAREVEGIESVSVSPLVAPDTSTLTAVCVKGAGVSELSLGPNEAADLCLSLGFSAQGVSLSGFSTPACVSFRPLIDSPHLSWKTSVQAWTRCDGLSVRGRVVG